MKQRLLFLLIAITCWVSLPQAMAQDSGVRLSIQFNGEPLTNVFMRLEQNSSYKFLFTYDDVANYHVTASFRNARFFDIVDGVLRDTPLEYKVSGKFIQVTLRDKKPSKEEMRTYGGYVFDENNDPIIGAQVRVVGTNIMAVTDVNGAYTFSYYLSDNYKVRVSYVGLKTVELPLRQKMNIHMKSDTKQLGDVVVTGIFRKAKESYTGAVSEIKREDLDTYRGANLLQTLKNIDASINFPMNNLAGSNPNVLPNLNIRGNSSLPMNVEEFNTNAEQTVNTPLIIMDGFEISLSKLMDYNDDQIESINILKDASATAIYGSRGANGVIVIVTKRPKEGKLRVQVKAGLNLETPDLSSYDMLNAMEKLQLEKAVGLYINTQKPEYQTRYNGYYDERMKNVLNGLDVDWLSKPLRNGVGQRYNIALDGGAREFRWGASVGYNDIKGAMKGSRRRNLTGDLTLMYQVKNLLFRNYASFTANHADESPYGSFSDYVDQEPYNNPYDENGNLVMQFYDVTHSQDQIGNPLYDASLNTFNKTEYNEFIDNFSIEWNILEGLRLRALFGVSTHRNTSDNFIPAESSAFNTSEWNSQANVMRKGSYTYGTGKSDRYSGNLTLSYTKTFAKKHQLYTGLDYSITESHSTDYTFRAEGFSSQDLSFLGTAMQYAQNAAPVGNKSIIRTVGLTANVNYSYDNRYYVDLSYRLDGSSRFGSDKRFAPFWSAGIGWNLHNEKFLYENKIVNTLRLKASYGMTGSLDFATTEVYPTYQYITGQRYLNWSGVQLLGLGNPNLTWQKTKEFNVGLEFGLLKNRIAGELNVYTKRTNNLLSAMNLPLSAGFSSYSANVGEMENKGFEASLRAYIIRDYDRQFNWMIGGQMVYNKEKIIKLSDAIKQQNETYMAQNVDVSNLFYEGRPMHAIYAVRSLGIDPATGKEVYLDKNGEVTSTWSAGDKVYLGCSQPLYRGTFNNMLMWHGITFNVSFAYHWGGKLYNSTLRDRVEVTKTQIARQNVDKRVLYDRWMNPGDVTFFRSFDDTNYDTQHATSRYVFDDRVLELSTISLQYRWATPWLKKNTHLESVVFAINANDLAYWSSVKYERGTSYPYARNFQGTVTVTF